MKAFSKLIRRINERASGTGDSEPEQAIKLRLSIGILLLLYFCVPWTTDLSFWENLGTIPSLIALGYYLGALIIAAAILYHPKPSAIRKVMGILLDLGSLSAVMLLAGDYSVPLFVLYLWVIHGNGFRFGTAYLYISQAVSLIGFFIAINWGGHWQSNLSIGYSLLIILCALPLYSAFLLRKLHSAIESAKQANEAKSRFLANMSHELRTPLNGVIGMGELLRETNLTFEQHELVNSMHSSANTLLDLIENVLDISKIEAGKLVIDSSPFDLHELVTSVRYMLAPMGEAKGLEVSCNIDAETPYSLIGDKPHIRQVLINLVNNAIKFTDEGSVTLNVYPLKLRTNKATIRFEITDTGIGISKDEQQRIFEDFTQASVVTSRHYGGTGLGTTISRDLVHLMGGEIALSSEAGKGSVFWFDLPFEVMPQPEQELKAHKLLLLSGEETASVIRPSLKNWTIDFDWVRSPARAFSQLVHSEESRQGYDIIIADQACMRDINPIQFAQMVKSETQVEDISMILVNSSDSVIEQNLINRYYVSTLDSGEDKRLLFNAIHAAQSVNFSDDNIVTLSEHYSRLGSKRTLQILVAEDNEVNQQVIEGILKHAGHRVTLVDSGDQALDVLATDLDNLDLVILDMNMPGKTGVEVVKALRFMDTAQPLPVVMLTADATPEAKETCLDAGANAFLTKPIDARLLVEKVAILTRTSLRSQKETTSTGKSSSTGAMVRGGANKIESSPWFDEVVFGELLKLGDGAAFLQNLVDGFASDGARHIESIMFHQNDDYPAYRESLHALKGSATELGATALVKKCLQGEALKPYHLGGDTIIEINREIEEIFNLTVAALKDAVTNQSAHQPGG